MKTNLKKILPIFVLAACAFIAPAFAYDEGHTESKPLIPQGKHPGGEDALAFFVGASYTYWVPYQEGMNIAFSSPTTATSSGNIIRPALTGSSGFKVELGANTQHDGWVGHLSYTWFNHQQSLRARPVLSGITYMSPFADEDTAATLYSAISSEFDMQFNRIHGAIDREFYAGHYLAFRPWIGLLGAWEEQRLSFNGTQNGNPSNIDQFRLTQNWWGIGPYAGVDCTYYVTNEWGVFLTTGGAMLLAEHSVHDSQNTNNANSITATDHNLNGSFGNVEPMIESALGVRWDSFWTDWALRIEAAWDLQTYFSHNGMLGVDEITGQMGNYSMQGLTVGVRVYF